MSKQSEAELSQSGTTQPSVSVIHVSTRDINVGSTRDHPTVPVSVGSSRVVHITPYKAHQGLPLMQKQQCLLQPSLAQKQQGHDQCQQQSMQQPFNQPSQQQQPGQQQHQACQHQQQKSGHKQTIIQKVLLKAFSNDKKSHKTFTLRNIDTGSVLSCDCLNRVIKVQLNKEIMDGNNFDVGFIQDSNLINIQNIEDLKEV